LKVQQNNRYSYYLFFVSSFFDSSLQKND